MKGQGREDPAGLSENRFQELGYLFGNSLISLQNIQQAYFGRGCDGTESGPESARAWGGADQTASINRAGAGLRSPWIREAAPFPHKYCSKKRHIHRIQYNTAIILTFL